MRYSRLHSPALIRACTASSILCASAGLADISEILAILRNDTSSVVVEKIFDLIGLGIRLGSGYLILRNSVSVRYEDSYRQFEKTP